MIKIPSHPKPTFQWVFLTPKYWLLWVLFGFSFIMSWLPFRIQLFLGKNLGRLIKRILKRRYQIAKRNLELCFPEMTQPQIKICLDQNFQNVGIAFFEVGMAWFWPDWRVKKHVEYRGFEQLSILKESECGCLFLATHFLNLEFGGRAFGLMYPGFGMYRPNKNRLYNWIQYRGRIKSNLGQIDRKQLKTLFYLLKNGGAVWYAPDHDYGRRNSGFAPFFAVKEAATTLGTTLFVDKTGCHVCSFTCVRVGLKYIIELDPVVTDFPHNNPQKAIEYANKIVERSILKAPEQYMWLHRRFKTRPNESDSSLYD